MIYRNMSDDDYADEKKYLLKLEPIVDSVYGAIEMPFSLAPNVIRIPVIVLNELIDLLDKILSNVEKIKVSKPHNCIFEIEFQPVNGIKMRPKNIQHRFKRQWIREACHKALSKFPHNINNFNPIGDFHFPLYHDKWFKMEITIYYDPKNSCYVVEFNRLCGYAFSFYKIYHQIENQINLIFDNTHTQLWLLRKNYINLLEGTTINDKNENHVTHYLLNDLLVKEISSFVCN